MILAYKVLNGILVECDRKESSVLVYNEPTDAEKKELLELPVMDQSNLDAIFDADEVPRVESVEGYTLIIWKRPDNVSTSDALQFGVSSIGIVLHHDEVILITPRGGIPVSGREFKKIEVMSDFVLFVLLHTLHHYQEHLKIIKTVSREIQAKIITSVGNRYFLQMFSIGESLIYYFNALEADLTVLSKLRAFPERFGFSDDHITLLDDLIIENQQASKQANIYSRVLSDLMDARGAIINNNVNGLLKNLTMINVVFLPLNLIASIGGMSEYSMMTHQIHWAKSYGALTFVMILVGLLTWWFLVNVIDKKQERRIRS